MGRFESKFTVLKEQRLYRVFRLGRFLELLHERRNTLTRPALWDDPWEEWWSQLLRRKVGVPLPPDVFGQCWTAVEESDAMWRVYAPLHDGVKVSTTYGVLLESLSDWVESESVTVDTATVVPVVYKSDEELKELGHKFVAGYKKAKAEYKKAKAKSIDLHTAPQDAVDEEHKYIAMSYFTQARYQNKRKAFDWEREFRVLARCPKCRSADTLSYPIDPSKLIQEVVFDPRMEESICAVVKEHIRKVGPTCRVYRSRLYSLDL